MTNPTFSIREILNKSWGEYKKNAGVMIGAVALYLIIYLFVVFLMAKISAYAGLPFGQILIQIIVIFINIFLLIGIIKIAFGLVNHEEVELPDLFKNKQLLIPFFVAQILYGLIVAAGMILLIVPGIIWAIQFSFYPLLIIERNLGPVEALKASSKLTQGHKWQLFNFFLLLILMNIAGMLVFGVGLLISIPISLLAYCYVYRQLVDRPST